MAHDELRKAGAPRELRPEALGLVPLLRGNTMLTCGPAEAPLAQRLLEIEKATTGFYVMGALLHSTRVLQARRGSVAPNARFSSRSSRSCRR